MTTAGRAVAEAHRLAPLIQRTPHGWGSRVNVQDWAPNTPRFAWSTIGRVDHCGLSLNSLHHNIGMTMGVHFPDAAWTPSGLAWFQQRGLVVPWQQMRPGDQIYFRDAGSQFSATHVGIADSYWLGNGFWCMEWNVDYTGRGRRLWRSPGYAVAACRPVYSEGEPAAPEPQKFVPFQDSEDDEMIVIEIEGDRRGLPKQWGVLGGCLFPILAPEWGGEKSRIRVKINSFLIYYGHYREANRLDQSLKAL